MPPQRGLQILPLPHAAHSGPAAALLTHKHKPKRPELVPVGKRRLTETPRVPQTAQGERLNAPPLGVSRLLERGWHQDADGDVQGNPAELHDHGKPLHLSEPPLPHLKKGIFKIKRPARRIFCRDSRGQKDIKGLIQHL